MNRNAVIDSLPIIYGGFFMRSRLEARWARFFELMGVRYLYEYKFFDTPYGQYLPDFYLPDFGLWIEIKPVEPSDEEVAKCRSVSDTTKEPCLIIGGFPYDCVTGPVRQIYAEASFWLFSESTNMASVKGWSILQIMEEEKQRCVRAALTESLATRFEERLLQFSDYVMFVENEVLTRNTYEHNQRISSNRMNLWKGKVNSCADA